MDVLKGYFNTYIYEINYYIVINIKKSLNLFYLFLNIPHL